MNHRAAELIVTTGLRREHRPGRATKRRGAAILLVIVAVAAAAVIGSAYVAHRLNTPQITTNVNCGAQARLLADSGADIATAIMECETIDWRTAQANGTLVADLAIGGGTVTIRVGDNMGDAPDNECEYPVIAARGKIGNMQQTVAALAHTPIPARLAEEVSVDLSEFAVFGASSINVSDGWITRWTASPLSELGRPVNIGSNATAAGRVRIGKKTDAPDSQGFVMSSANSGVITDSTGTTQPIRRINFSVNETVLLPAPPTPTLGGLTWAAARNPSITSNVNQSLTSDKRYNSLTVDNGATLTIDLGGASRTAGITGTLTIQNGGVLSIRNGHLDLVIQGALNMFSRGAIELGPGATVRIFLGGTMSVNDSVIGLPASYRYESRDGRNGLAEYFDPQRCIIYRITSINSVDLDLLDLDDAASWLWSDTTSKSWFINDRTFVCGRIYGHSKADISMNNQAGVFGNVVGLSVIVSGGSAVHYDHTLDRGNGYTNPQSRLYAGPLDLRDDLRLLLTDLNTSTIDSILALLGGGGGGVPVVGDDQPTPRDASRVRHRAWRQYGLRIWRQRELGADDNVALINN